MTYIQHIMPCCRIIKKKKSSDSNKPTVPPDQYVEIAGVKWAKMNIGATSETDSGLFFAWGETDGYVTAGYDTYDNKKYFGWENYKFGEDPTKYNSEDNLTVLQSEDDAATVNLGDQWRMPTAEEIQLLIDSTNCELVQVNQYRYYYKLTDKNDSSKVLIFSYGGYKEENKGYKWCYYWTSSSVDGNNSVAKCFYLGDNSSTNPKVSQRQRRDGLLIRPVVK